MSPNVVQNWPAPAATTIGAGWYQDPDDSTRWRWWDGVRWTQWRDNKPVPAAPRTTIAYKWGWLTYAVVLLAVVVGSWFAVTIGADQWPAPLNAVGAIAVVYGPIVAWCVHVARRCGGTVESVFSYTAKGVDVAWGIVGYLGIIAVQTFVVTGLLAAGIPTASNVADILTPEFAALVLAAVIAAPVVEELAFRGVIMTSLSSRHRLIPMLALQAVMFGSAHFNPAFGTGNIGLLIVLSVVGVGLGVIRHYTRRVGAAVVTHAIYNGVAVLVVSSGLVEWLENNGYTDLGGAVLRHLLRM